MVVEITVIMSMNEESEEALEACCRAARELLKSYGIKAYVIPLNTWTSTPFGMLGNEDLPMVMINGEVLVAGRAPTVREIIDYVLTKYKLPNRSMPSALPHKIAEPSPMGTAATYA